LILGTTFWPTQKVHGAKSNIVVSRLSTYQVSAPSPPTPVSPGFSSEPGQVIDNLIPTFQWTGVSGADLYGLYISQSPYGQSNIIYTNESISGSSTSFQIPSGYLQDGIAYRWNMTAHNSAGWGGVSGRLFFKTDLSLGRQQLIQAIQKLEDAISQLISQSTHDTADTYAYSAVAADLTHWWSELARAALDTINTVVGLVMKIVD